MVIYGDKDNLVNPKCPQDIADYLDCKIVKVEGHPHGLETTAPGVIADSMIVILLYIDQEIIKTSNNTNFKCFKPMEYKKDYIHEIFSTQTIFRYFIVGYVLCSFSCLLGFVFTYIKIGFFPTVWYNRGNDICILQIYP